MKFRSASVWASGTLLWVLAGCGPSPAVTSTPSEAAVASESTTMPASPQAPGSWQDWQSYTNVSPGPWVSNTHGKRFVEIYVNAVGLQAYKEDAPMPVGSIVVKPSWENQDGAKGASGPLFVMEKMPEGYAPDSGDWFYAFQWPDAPAKWKDGDGRDPDWRSPSAKIEYCSGCHDNLKRNLGMPPKERQWR